MPGKSLLSAAALAAGALLSSPALYAQEVQLSTTDGGITLTGELLEFTGETFILATSVGKLEIDAFSVVCEGAACPPPELMRSDFRIAGAKSISEGFLPALIDAYGFDLDVDVLNTLTDDGSELTLTGANDENLATINLAGLGSTGGLKALLDGEASLAVTSRPLRNREARAFADAGLGNLADPENEKVLALDGLVVVTSRDNPVRAIRETDVPEVFSGRINNWSQLGGPDAPIRLYVRDESSGTREVFDNLVMRPVGLAVADQVISVDNDDAIADLVSADPYGIGFTGFASLRNAKGLAIEGVCGLQTPPTAFTIKTEEYPLTRRLYMYQTNRPKTRHAKALMDFALSDMAQQVIADAGFIDQAITAETINAQGLRLASALTAPEAGQSFGQLQDMVGTLINADRLSTTFRFETGSSELDSKAQADIQRLAAQLMEGKYDNKELLLVGFTDSVGQADLNQFLSADRAGQVQQALLDAAGGDLPNVKFRVLGYGEISPLGCNETFQGRLINRRVEVWTRDLVGGE
ncbi:substrate-binding domain-containing protein [Oceanomicrobium pacificus]|uniref:OmpA family protein n=1 Tax=Oceanomicrobium pacificus TaxID=2692916 RepID=A0A6B0TPB6_9RHOB|nr:phosphate ABC transporter substrate-binding/OmpA family protein [Oceanomicrobium pacificus]MXU66470.1 OmpA family protein [Oceanomicrobium pacificus]